MPRMFTSPLYQTPGSLMVSCEVTVEPPNKGHRGQALVFREVALSSEKNCVRRRVYRMAEWRQEEVISIVSLSKRVPLYRMATL